MIEWKILYKYMIMTIDIDYETFIIFYSNILFSVCFRD